MIAADSFLTPARRRGFDFYTGVPCSFLTPVINRVISDVRLDYVAAASEGEAVAIAAGAWLAGRRTVVICQNSGLGNAVNPLTSLNHPFRIPTLMIVTWRGEPGLKDEPQHALMGPITPALLDTIRVPHRPFPESESEVEPLLAKAEESMEATGLPFALIMRKGSVAEEGLDAAPLSVRQPGVLHDLTAEAAPPTRVATLERMLATLPDSAAVIATTGKAGRELFTLADRPQHLYQVGSMGCAGAMGLGTALAVGRPVVVVDGDGAALMKLGAFATIGAYAPRNLVHLVLDNGTYDSTGGQMTVSAAVDFARVAIACGYANGFSCDDLDGFADALERALAGTGPHLIHMRIAPGSMEKLGRPTITPPEVARRFRAFLAGTGA
ncbi:phosphonopyruvate decarboxylase [Shumkonia mesophila]|uniref:phosphonopyruvate decarboxylase n=1 Tax=Shumkonia mesophila TaxID=2838854 RepID=UPI00293523DD|nr:phosphonopyruvate decarboxylase [Shumkonia mesophila]